jgi:ATP-dependent DNA helicase RecQ
MESTNEPPASSLLEALAGLQRWFGHASFRPGQEAVIGAVMSGRDVLVVMPTGSGKSLAYQLPAVLLPGTTLVVSPLISLMKDQVDQLEGKGIRAAALHSLLSEADRRGVVTAFERRELKLLYVAPERFASAAFRRVLAGVPVARFAVDEAHCVSEWGHDFRPDYRLLADAARSCRRSDGRPGRPPMLALTATATPEVRDDIVQLLDLSRPELVVTGFDRPNLRLAIRPVDTELDKLAMLPQLVKGRRAIVYAATRASAELAAAALQSEGMTACAYHAGLAEAERTRVQDGFAAGRIPIVCATNAFGMGIDRPDVEAVVHVELPGSLEAYYQEIGRGGRDGRTATVTLLWNYRDVKTREFLIERGAEENPSRRGRPLDPAERERRRELDRVKLRRMVAYANSTGCLRAAILRYFGERPPWTNCGTCATCGRRQPLGDADLLIVRKILSGIARAGQRYGKRKITAMLVGDVDDLPAPLTRLSTTGLLRAEGGQTVERWLDAAVSAGLVRESADKYRTLALTELGREVMAGRRRDVEVAVPPARRIRRSRRRR